MKLYTVWDLLQNNAGGGGGWDTVKTRSTINRSLLKLGGGYMGAHYIFCVLLNMFVIFCCKKIKEEKIFLKNPHY